ncbi:btb/poz domain-containing protein [Anaeramoeba flamelloides]|uniref:Btb/poz domain-containing protein n=1 Tax=Anaeramoeba flamelloides TaxID=1746091 RepID=A0ABQ8Z5U6_9EUKA|nr:btb/poz domain-containing protein [Anaeramoeba flamelloides]
MSVSFRSVFEQLFNNQRLSDLIFFVGKENKQYYVHNLLLSLSSNFFAQHLNNQINEEEENTKENKKEKENGNTKKMTKKQDIIISGFGKISFQEQKETMGMDIEMNNQKEINKEKEIELEKEKEKEKQKQVVRLPDTNPEIFEIILKFCYSHQINKLINHENALGLLFSANVFQMKELIQICIAFIHDNLNESNCFETLQIAVTLKLNLLANDILNWISKKVSTVFEKPMVCNQLRRLAMISLIRSLYSDHRSSILVFRRIVEWAREKCAQQKLEINTKNLKKEVSPLLTYLRLDNFSREEIHEVLSCGFFEFSSKETSNLINSLNQEPDSINKMENELPSNKIAKENTNQQNQKNLNTSKIGRKSSVPFKSLNSKIFDAETETETRSEMETETVSKMETEKINQQTTPMTNLNDNKNEIEIDLKQAPQSISFTKNNHQNTQQQNLTNQNFTVNQNNVQISIQKELQNNQIGFHNQQVLNQQQVLNHHNQQQQQQQQQQQESLNFNQKALKKQEIHISIKPNNFPQQQQQIQQQQQQQQQLSQLGFQNNFSNNLPHFFAAQNPNFNQFQQINQNKKN